ncbi:hypothetical protein JCM3774_005126 [Rhodotorula dairenensis]
MKLTSNTTASQQRRPSVAPAKTPSRWSSRLDSVYAVYAEMYPEMDEDELALPNGFVSREDERGKTLSSYTALAATAGYSTETPTTPWDERGATGLYGGGGRGADDKETGWARNFAFNLPPSDSGFEEDLRFEQDTSSQASTPLASPRFARTPSPDRSASGHLDDTANSASSLRRAREHAETPASVQHEPEPEKAHPDDTIDVGQIKKQHVMSAVPAPPSGPVLSSPKHALKMRPKLPRTPTLKWRPRSKKTLSISTPILPPGFVESLGMETFPLHPVTEEEEVSTPALPSVSAAPPAVASSPTAPTMRTLTPPRTPSIKRELARNPKLSPVGFGRESVTSESTQLPPPPSSAAPPVVVVAVTESDEASRGQRVQEGGPFASWSDHSPAVDLDDAPSPTLNLSSSSSPPPPRSWDCPAHGRGDSSSTSNSGFRDPWAPTHASTSSWSAHSHAEVSSSATPSNLWNAGYPHVGAGFVPPALPRFRQDSVASHYSDSGADADAPPASSSSAATTYRRSQPLSVVRRGENTYSFASLSPSTCGPEEGDVHPGPTTSSWRFPPGPAAVPLAGMSGFRNPFS